MRKLLPILALLLGACTTTQSRHVVESAPLEAEQAQAVEGRVLDDFEADDAAGLWTRYDVEGSVHPLTHETVNGAMQLTSDSSAGLLWRAFNYNPVTEPLLRWRWRVSRTFDKSTPLAPEFDNFPARVLVGFDSGWDDAGPVALTWRGKVEKAAGVTPPARAICYTFGGSLDSREAVDAAFGEGRIVVINLRKADAKTGHWHSEVRDIASDYRAIFGEPPPRVMAIGLGCDSHRLKEEASAWFDDLTVYPPEARAQFAAKLDHPPERRMPTLAWIIIAACVCIATASAGAWFWMREGRRS